MGKQVVGLELACLLLVGLSLVRVRKGLVRESRTAGPRQLSHERVAGAGVVAAGGSRGVRHHANGQGLVTKLGMRRAWEAGLLGPGWDLVGEPPTVIGASLKLVRELEGATMQVWKGLVRESLRACALAGEKALRVIR